MNIKKIRLPIIILAIGLVAIILSHFVVSAVKAPSVSEYEFTYSVTYRIAGETKTLQGKYRCTFDGYGGADEPFERFYTGEHTEPVLEDREGFIVAQKDGRSLAIWVIFNDCYLMGDTENEYYGEEHSAPEFVVYDTDGGAYDDEELLAPFDAEIVSWEYPEPIENTFNFAGFAPMNFYSMLAMLVVGAVLIIVCACFVKKDESATDASLDKVSLVFNFIVGLVAIPFAVLVAFFMPLTLDITDPAYFVFLLIPVFTEITIAVSVAARRVGFTKTGFFVQFIGPAFFFLYVFVESLITNLFY